MLRTDQLRTDQLRTDQCAQPALISPCHLRFEHCSPSLRLGGAHPYCTPRYVNSLLYIANTRETNSSVPALHLGSCCIIVKSSIGPYVNCKSQCHLGRRQVHAFDSQDLIDVYLPDGPQPALYHLPPYPAPEPEPEEGAGEEGVSESESADSTRSTSPTALAPASAVPDVRDPPAELSPVPSLPTLPRGRSSTRSSRSSTSGGPPQPPPPPQRPPSPLMPIMSSPTTTPNKETLKLLLPLRYDSKTVIECDRFLSQLRIYWLINTSLTTIELKVQVVLSLLDGDARAWATPYFTQLASVQMGVQGVTTPFRDEAAFTAAFKARFGNLDDEAVIRPTKP
ncbi:hypothetical protein POSPLADRAFT_1144002 [Postia placenta MAD-698-R-SB12]|uniref:DUF4939 domain-containing protein n=1 Tax=Postia placenta MAD-698-R-SB12 TaxID=670580 RepID=A0A1X6MZ98_9APHY|nr:hypothetical protein POSPLADRAFT_1144002 [Postia placenta MAD-698-R-SB12]OSX61513.1 hypothetical protein POSPLADRAFT_1144002 [Postia placenta MAD-698-R-SB12]